MAKTIEADELHVGDTIADALEAEGFPVATMRIENYRVIVSNAEGETLTFREHDMVPVG